MDEIRIGLIALSFTPLLLIYKGHCKIGMASLRK